MKRKNFYPVLLVLFIFSCSGEENKRDGKQEEIHLQDSTAVYKSTADAPGSASEHEIPDSLINLPEEVRDSILNVIRVDEMLKEEQRAWKKEWANADNPMIATFEGYSMGDYEHILFLDNKGNRFDFAYGNNDFGKLSKDDFYSEDSKYVNKKFKVYWDFKMSEFTCCEGEDNWVKGEAPSITKLELIR